MSAAAPWMPLYVADYLADTAHLTAAEHGAYLLLIMHYWRAGKLPSDERQVARIARMSPREWDRSRDTIAAFFDDGWRHKRIENEIAKSTSRSHARAESGSRGGKAKALKNKDAALANATILPEQNPTVALASSSQSHLEKKEDVSLRSTSGAGASNSQPDPPPEKPPDKSRGTRLPDGWHPGPDWLTFTKSEGLTDDDARRALDEFRDYWRGVAGARGRKADWVATWRNRVREVSSRTKRLPRQPIAGGSRQEPGSTLAAYQRAAARFQEPTGVPGRSLDGSDHNGPLVELPVYRAG